MNERVYIWGTGNRADEYLNLKELNDDQILGFIESNRTKKNFMGKKVYEPQEICDMDNYDYILVCVDKASCDIYKTVKKYEMPIEKILFCDNYMWAMEEETVKSGIPKRLCQKINECNDIDKIKEVFPKFYQCFWKNIDEEVDRYIITKNNGYDLVESDNPLNSKEFEGVAYRSDYFRFRTFLLMANEVKRRDVEGNVAELGVFRGTFAKLINCKFKDRNLYLFDTFSSFDENEFMKEVNDGRCNKEFKEVFKNTSEKGVLDIMPYPEKCIIRKGFFPDTAVGLENERYAFVSLDVDLEKSILEGLRYFYPRLSDGGVIFLHDYNNYFLEGVKIAVDTYEKEIGCYLKKVPLADEGGTLVICK